KHGVSTTSPRGAPSGAWSVAASRSSRAERSSSGSAVATSGRLLGDEPAEPIEEVARGDDPEPELLERAAERVVVEPIDERVVEQPPPDRAQDEPGEHLLGVEPATRLENAVHLGERGPPARDVVDDREVEDRVVALARGGDPLGVAAPEANA